jgi:hypothetical protein
VVAIQRVVDLALTYRAALHVVHVSTADGAEILVRNRPLGKLSFETCPQYLVLDDTWLQRPDGHRWLCSPPLRACRPRLRELARAGAADIIATDHCAFRPEDKDDWDGKDLRTVANGLPGIGALPHLAWQLWEDDADRAAFGLATHLALNPARRAAPALHPGPGLRGLPRLQLQAAVPARAAPGRSPGGGRPIAGTGPAPGPSPATLHRDPLLPLKPPVSRSEPCPARSPTTCGPSRP